MARKSRLSIVKPQIEAFFNSNQKKLYTPTELSSVLVNHGDVWRLPMSITTRQFIKFLEERSKLKEINLYGSVMRYLWGDTHDNLIYEVALSLKSKSYLSHYSAAFLHDLTEQIPKNIYVTFEQSLKPNIGELTQQNIDDAFQKPIRKSANAWSFLGYNVTLLNGKFTGRTGVISKEDSLSGAQLRITDLERTLIDIAVRPEYSGGVHEVVKAYKLAKDRIAINVLKAYLRKMDFTYPYHQVIGFYLEYTGYSENRLKLMDDFDEKQFDFYLAHNLGEISYSPRWRLYYPKSFDA
jgi:predicted transcriptional regulator of viral defense system